MKSSFLRIFLPVLTAAVALAILPVAACAQQPSPKAALAPAGEEKAPAKPALTVAVLDFTCDTEDGAAVGKQVADILTASLSGVDGLTLVDRSSIARTLQEHELNLAGLVR